MIQNNFQALLLALDNQDEGAALEWLSTYPDHINDKLPGSSSVLHLLVGANFTQAAIACIEAGADLKELSIVGSRSILMRHYMREQKLTNFLKYVYEKSVNTYDWHEIMYAAMIAQDRPTLRYLLYTPPTILNRDAHRANSTSQKESIDKWIFLLVRAFRLGRWSSLEVLLQECSVPELRQCQKDLESLKDTMDEKDYTSSIVLLNKHMVKTHIEESLLDPCASSPEHTTCSRKHMKHSPGGSVVKI